MEMSKDLWEDFDTGEVYIRDRWQFELKSEFFPRSTLSTSQYVQEFYLFIPSSLQINPNTYPKHQFYFDQTNFIRYKTPRFTFDELFDLNNQASPFTRLFSLPVKADNSSEYEHLEDELKLFANVVRSSLRDEIKSLISKITSTNSEIDPDLEMQVTDLCKNLNQVYQVYDQIKLKYLNVITSPFFVQQVTYTREFIDGIISHYLTRLLESVRLKNQKGMANIDDMLCSFLINQNFFESNLSLNSISNRANKIQGEQFLYKSSLLNKFVLDALQLTTNRFSMDQRYHHWISSLSAGVAMLLYFSLYVWLGGVFIINSAPFIFLTVIIYVLKNQIEDWLNTVSYLHASRLFSDYTTVIQSLDRKNTLGKIQEFVTFIRPEQLSEELRDIRNTESHTTLEGLQRTENVLFYKRIIEINNTICNTRRHGFNIIFRFNIHQFLHKASDPLETHLILDPITRKLLHIHLPKVYHLNLIIKTTEASVAVPSRGNEVIKPRVEFKVLRIIIDKNGIKRIEQLEGQQAQH